jgi:mannose-6-phosphate isomerase-like protein (cupin superfamily)
MAKLISNPSVKIGKGSKGDSKVIEEYFGKTRTNQDDVSIAVMTAKQFWEEPEQIAEFDEYVYVIRGTLLVKVSTNKKPFRVNQGTAIVVHKGEYVQFSTPYMEGASYIAICLPAYQEHLVKRDE